MTVPPAHSASPWQCKPPRLLLDLMKHEIWRMVCLMSTLFKRRAPVVLWIAALNVFLFAVFAGLRLSRPSDGARLQPGTQAYTPDGVIVTPFEGQSSVLLAGDVVTAIEGRSVESWAGYLLCWEPFCSPPERPRWQVGDTVAYTILRDNRPIEVEVTLTRYPLGANLRQDWSSILYALALFAIGVFVFYRRPDETAARLLLLLGSSMVGATTWSFGLQATDLLRPAVFWLHWITTGGVYLLIWIASLHFALVFPNPHRLVQRHRWLLPLIYILPFAAHLATLTITVLTASSIFDWMARMGPDQNLTVLLYLLLSLVALITNYRSQPDSLSRQQIRVVVYAIGLITAVAVLLWQAPQIILGEQIFPSSLMAVVGLLLPVSLAVSIMRYRLWDIELIINRTAVYGLLSILIAGLYVAVVGILGAMLRQRGSLLPSLIATGAVAVIVHPLRERLQRAVNRFMYGERDDLYQVISRLGRQLQAAAAPEDLLETITRTLASALKLPYASIALLEDGSFKKQAEYGIPPGDPITLPLVYQKEVVGQLAVAQRGPHEPLTPPDMRLLESIAYQAGGAVHAMRLLRDLRRSREKLVLAREEERRRLRRDLHDGLGPTLASHALTLDTVLDLIRSDPDSARELVQALRNQMQETIADIRRLVYELRPPALDELGLVEALQAHISRLADTTGRPSVTLEVAPSSLPVLPAAVEVAAYRIAHEALTNVVRHAEARRCVIRFSSDGASALRLTISDDGVGLPSGVKPGVGLLSMRERAVELGGECRWERAPGGGTRITVVLPLDGLER